MSEENASNRTVFRPSPLQQRREAQADVQPAGPAPAGPAGQKPSDDEVPAPSKPTPPRNVLVAEAGRLLALVASVRSGRADLSLPKLHAIAEQAVAAFDRRAAEAGYPETHRMRAKYALCATVDDIAQNLPGRPGDGAEWARRSLVVLFFKENVGGERFWQLVDDMLARPSEWADLIELFHACLAAGFEGRFRVAPDGKRRLHEIMTQLYGALEHVRGLSGAELSPAWRGVPTPPEKVGFWSVLALAASLALGFLLVVFIAFRLGLFQTGQPAVGALAQVVPDQPLKLSRSAALPPPPRSDQVDALRRFLAPEIAKGLVKVEPDASAIRVRTTVGQLFRSGSEQLEPGREALFARIAAAVETQPGPVRVEGYTDADKPRSSLTFPDNTALSEARARTVADLLRRGLTDGSRVTSEGFGEARPIGSNATSEGKALNRRVEIVVARAS